jgi:ribonuclease BN (tRNA processing enzyme)
MTDVSIPNAELTLRFLGVGSAQASALGSSSAVLERSGAPLLLIDVGIGVLDRHRDVYVAAPTAAFITHTHLDHVGDLESWFYRLAFATAPAALPRLYVPATVVPLLQRRIADFPNWVAEGGRNFWDVFQLVPVSDHFWHAGMRFVVFPVRHHAPESAYGLSLPGSFLYTGDTRPVPEWLQQHGRHGERIFHDCAPVANPSHTGIEDLVREYGASIRGRLVLYHYPDSLAASLMREHGYPVATPGEVFELPEPNDDARYEFWLARSRA